MASPGTEPSRFRTQSMQDQRDLPKQTIQRTAGYPAATGGTKWGSCFPQKSTWIISLGGAANRSSRKWWSTRQLAQARRLPFLFPPPPIFLTIVQLLSSSIKVRKMLTFFKLEFAIYQHQNIPKQCSYASGVIVVSNLILTPRLLRRSDSCGTQFHISVVTQTLGTFRSLVVPTARAPFLLGENFNASTLFIIWTKNC